MLCTKARQVLPDQAVDQVGGGVMRSRFGHGDTLSKRRFVGAFLCERKCFNNISLYCFKGMDSNIVFESDWI